MKNINKNTQKQYNGQRKRTNKREEIINSKNNTQKNGKSMNYKIDKYSYKTSKYYVRIKS